MVEVQGTDDTGSQQAVVALDLEGVLTPEIWPAIGAALAVPGLEATLRDTSDYRALLRRRLAAIESAGLGFDDIVAVVGALEPLPGAVDLLDRLRSAGPVVILTDTFDELARPLLEALGRPFTLCHRLDVRDGRISGFRLRSLDSKREAVVALQGLGYRVVAAGDGLNDVSMVRAADHGCLYRPPPSLRREADLPVVDDLAALERWIAEVTVGFR